MNDIMTIIIALVIWDAVKYFIATISKALSALIRLSGYIEGVNEAHKIDKKGL